MSPHITINIINNAPFEQDFFIFQMPVIYKNQELVYSNSIFCESLQPYSTAGAVLTCQISTQLLAGAQAQTGPLHVGQLSGLFTATEQVEVARVRGSACTNTTDLSISPLGFTPAYSHPGVEPGKFRIVTPSYPDTHHFNVGSALLTSAGEAILSSFIVAPPMSYVDYIPVWQFFVQVGRYRVGSVLTLSHQTPGAAVCDAHYGHNTFNVTYSANGTLSVRPE